MRFVQPTRAAHIKLAALLLVVALAFLAAASALVLALRNQQGDIQQQAAGRRVAVRATCLIQRAIIDAGIQALNSGVLLPGDSVTGGTFMPGALTRQLGAAYPAYPMRVESAERAARAYRDRIAEAVREAAGTDQTPLTDGHLDCAKLAAVSKATTQTGP